MSRIADWFFRDRTTGRYVIGQWPNVPLLVFVVARILEWVTGALGVSGTAGDVLHWVGTGALVWWAADELLRGVNPFRRMLGAGALVFVIAGFVAS